MCSYLLRRATPVRCVCAARASPGGGRAIGLCVIDIYKNNFCKTALKVNTRICMRLERESIYQAKKSVKLDLGNCIIGDVSLSRRVCFVCAYII